MSHLSYKDLIVWQRSITLASITYDICRQLPRSEDFALTSQMQRAVVSIASNIAEGQERNSTKEFQQFLAIARGSAAELETQLTIVEKVYNINTSTVRQETIELRKMIKSLSKQL